MKGCRPLEAAEIETVLASFAGEYAPRDRALFLLGVRSGFRISELLSLTIGDVLQAGRLVERVAVRRRNMKKKIEGRAVVLHPQARAALEAWVRELQAEGHAAPETFVFRSRKGENSPIGRVQAWRILNTRFAAAGMVGKLGTHSMRKTFAARVYERLGRDLLRTAAALGHRNINSTVQYLSFCEADIDAAVLAA
ncbi:MAG: tyrosine-type recombinase/integrase [Elusimicrobia bacterium]|nr:tyrosine-type recombinase/integrase [Elusimicrobiota bacterium]